MVEVYKMEVEKEGGMKGKKVEGEVEEDTREEVVAEVVVEGVVVMLKDDK